MHEEKGESRVSGTNPEGGMKTERNFEVSDMGENRNLFKFKKQEDMDRVLLLSPWSFDKYLVILHKL